MGYPRIQPNRRYGLKDLLHALLFLFYEPNFAHAWNVSVAVAEEGLTMEETIEKTFHGGFVNGIKYEPNKAWLLWTKENDNESVHDPSEDQNSEVMSCVIKSGCDDVIIIYVISQSIDSLVFYESVVETRAELFCCLFGIFLHHLLERSVHRSLVDTGSRWIIM